MSRKLKTLGLCSLAMFALSALGASAAHGAPEFHCTTTTTNCFVTGSNSTNPSFELASPTKMHLGCRGLQLKATAEKRTTSGLDATPTFSGCTYFGTNATINTNGCFFRFILVERSSPATATVDIVCPPGKKIVINMPALPVTFEIVPQTGLSHAVFTNTGSEPTDVEAALTITGLAYTSIGGGAGGTNPSPPGENFNNGELSGTVALSGFNDEGGVEGNKVGLHVF